MLLFCWLPLNCCKVLNLSVGYKPECRTKSVRKDNRVEEVKKRIIKENDNLPSFFFYYLSFLIVKTLDFTIKTDGKTKYHKVSKKYKPEELWHWSEASSVVPCISSVYVVCVQCILSSNMCVILRQHFTGIENHPNKYSALNQYVIFLVSDVFR